MLDCSGISVPKMKKTTLLASCIAAALTANAQPLPVTSADAAEAEAHFVKAPHPPLKELQERFPDGAKGFYKSLSSKREALPADPAARRKAVLRKLLCSSERIVLAKAGASASFMTASSVFTKFRFEVVDTVYPAQGGSPETVQLIREGGEASDGGEKFRVINTTNTEYKTGQLYLLALKKLASGASYFSDQPTLEVRGGRIFPDDGDRQAFQAATPLPDAIAAIRDTAGTLSCPLSP
jgi:hypothetical protein